jgi:hypothetical protein
MLLQKHSKSGHQSGGMGLSVFIQTIWLLTAASRMML